MLTCIFLSFASIQSICMFNYYLWVKKLEYLVYILYVVLISVFVLGSVIGQYCHATIPINNHDVFLYGRGFLIASFGVYYFFGRLFTNINQVQPNFATCLEYVSVILLTIGLFDIISLKLGSTYFAFDYAIKYFMLGVGIFSVYAIYVLLKTGDKLNIILVIGSFALLIGSGIGLIDMIFLTRTNSAPEDYRSCFIIGIFIEFCCILFGLMYKYKLGHIDRYKRLRQEFSSEINLNDSFISRICDNLISMRAIVDRNNFYIEKKSNAILSNSNLNENIESISIEIRIHHWAYCIKSKLISDFIEFIKNDIIHKKNEINCCVENISKEKYFNVNPGDLEEFLLAINDIVKKAQCEYSPIMTINNSNNELEVVFRNLYSIKINGLKKYRNLDIVYLDDELYLRIRHIV